MSNTVGISNVAVGTNSLLLDISGSYNTAIGTATLLNNLANSNTAIGSNSMENNIIGKENVAIGIQSGYENIDGSKLVAEIRNGNTKILPYFMPIFMLHKWQKNYYNKFV